MLNTKKMLNSWLPSCNDEADIEAEDESNRDLQQNHKSSKNTKWPHTKLDSFEAVFLKRSSLGEIDEFAIFWVFFCETPPGSNVIKLFLFRHRIHNTSFSS
jgi:hypothetical protein